MEQNDRAQALEVTKKQATEIYELERQIKALKTESIRNKKELKVMRDDNTELKATLEKIHE